ncbi:hypothetical protein UlMin_033361 [Ulmus minor]
MCSTCKTLKIEDTLQENGGLITCETHAFKKTLLTSLRHGPFTEKMTCECPQYLFVFFLSGLKSRYVSQILINNAMLYHFDCIFRLLYLELRSFQLTKFLLLFRKSSHREPRGLNQWICIQLNHGDWVGYFSYDTVRYVEKRKVPFSMAPKDERNLADIHLGLYDDVLVFDHVEKKVYVIHWVRLDRYSSIEMAYEDGVKHLASLLAGVQSLTPRTFADPFEIYRALRVVNPSPYMTHLQARGCILVASSLEILTRVNKNLELQLLSNEKQCAEHIMLVDLGQNDVGKVWTLTMDLTLVFVTSSWLFHFIIINSFYIFVRILEVDEIESARISRVDKLRVFAPEGWMNQ